MFGFNDCLCNNEYQECEYCKKEVKETRAMSVRDSLNNEQKERFDMGERAWYKVKEEKSKAELERQTIRMDIEAKLEQIPDIGSKGVKASICGDIRILLAKLVDSYERT